MISAGFIVLSKDLSKILLGRASSDMWTTFKGHVETGETELDAAIRELKEESGIDISTSESLQKNMSSGIVHEYQLKNKRVKLYLLVDSDNVLDGFTFFCNSYYGNGKPEILDYKWMDIDEAEKKVFNSQKPMVSFVRTIKESRNVR